MHWNQTSTIKARKKKEIAFILGMWRCFNVRKNIIYQIKSFTKENLVIFSMADEKAVDKIIF